MAVNLIETMDEFVRFVQQTPQEVDALFRDQEAFKALKEKAIPRLFDERPQDSLIRVWVPGCATGEEAYSIAILLAEHQETLRHAYRIQIFATDIDSQAMATARNGVYPASINADVIPERLARFFFRRIGRPVISHCEAHTRHAGLFRAGRDQSPPLL